MSWRLGELSKEPPQSRFCRAAFQPGAPSLSWCGAGLWGTSPCRAAALCQPPLLPVQVPRDGSTLWGQSTKSILPQGSTRSLSKTHPHFPHPKTSPRWDLWGLSCTPTWVPAPPEEGSGSKAPAGEAGGAAAAQAGQIFPRLEKQLLITDKTPSGDFAPFSSPPPAGAFAEGKTISPQTGMAQPGPRMYTRDQTLDQGPGR